MAEFWLISAPGEKTCTQTWETLNNVLSKHNDLCNLCRITIPDFKVGTLDSLMGLSDELYKLDLNVEQTCLKLANCVRDLLEGKPVDELKVNGKYPDDYLKCFQWEHSKYPAKQSLTALHDIINKQTAQTDADLKSRSTAYNAVKTNLQTLERKQVGSLLVRNLGDIVKEEDFVLGSEMMTTLLVVVPNAYINDWNARYEHLIEMVVPQSSRMIIQDNEHGLFNVIVFRKFINEFKAACRENKFTVRDYQFNKQEIEEGKTKLAQLEIDKTKTSQTLLRWLKTHFSETFMAWIHVKILRLFVDSVLRYGLPVNFLTVLIQPNKKQAKKLRGILNTLYAHLDSSFSAGPIDDIPGLNVGQQEYFPYVSLKVCIDIFGVQN